MPVVKLTQCKSSIGIYPTSGVNCPGDVLSQKAGQMNTATWCTIIIKVMGGDIEGAFINHSLADSNSGIHKPKDGAKTSIANAPDSNAVFDGVWH